MNERHEILDEIDPAATPCNYCDFDEIDNFINGCENFLIVHHNIRSYNRNFDKLSVQIDKIKSNIDVLVLTETWFCDELCVGMDGFDEYHVCRKDRSGGGVSIYVRAGLNSSLVNDLCFCDDALEICTVQVKPQSNDKYINIVGIYRPPNGSLAIFSDKISDIVEQCNSVITLLSGDFNIDLLDDINVDFSSMLYSHNFNSLITIPTRVTDNSATCIDHIWQTGCSSVVAGAIVSDITDHYPVFAVLNFPNSNDVIKVVFRDHSESNIVRLCEGVSGMVNDYFEQCSDKDVDFRTNWFHDSLWNLYNSHCARKVKICSLKKYLKPWISPHIRRMLNYKHHLFKKYKQELISFDFYNSYKNNISTILNKAKKDYYRNKFSLCYGDGRSTWKTINSLLNNKRQKQKIVSLLDNDGNEFSEPRQMADAFCNYFSNVADNLDASIPQTNTDPMSFMPDPIPQSFVLNPSTNQEVDALIKSLPNKSSHINNIPVFIYKRLSSLISPIISDIFNCAVSAGQFPTILKRAKITPIYKSKNRKLTENYRPISILLFLAKILEKLTKVRAISFINDNKILFNQQFGFRAGYSTTWLELTIGSKLNRLSLNIDKTNFMILTHGKYDERDINIKIRDTRLRPVKCTKFLGLMIDNRLSYCDNLTKLQKQLSRVKGVLLKLSYILPVYIIKQLYYALFHSRMAYGVAVWGGSGVTNVNKIRSICNSTRNIFCNKIPANSPKVLTYDDVYALSCLTLFRRMSCGGGGEYFRNKIATLVPNHPHLTRHVFENKFAIPCYRKTVSQNQFLYNSVKLFNRLPCHLSIITETCLFKRELKNFLRSCADFFLPRGGRSGPDAGLGRWHLPWPVADWWSPLGGELVAWK